MFLLVSKTEAVLLKQIPDTINMHFYIVVKRKSEKEKCQYLSKGVFLSQTKGMNIFIWRENKKDLFKKTIIIIFNITHTLSFSSFGSVRFQKRWKQYFYEILLQIITVFYLEKILFLQW